MPDRGTFCQRRTDAVRSYRASRTALTLAWLIALTPPGALAAPADDQTDTEPAPMEGAVGDAERGRAIVLDRAVGNCLICHKVPVPEEAFQGDLGPDLTGVGGRLSGGQLRYRLVDQSRLNPETMMPPFYRTERLTRVAERFAGRPALSAQQVEDVVAWLSTLKVDDGSTK